MTGRAGCGLGSGKGPRRRHTPEGLRVAASASALQGEAGGVRLRDLACETVALAQAGLAARGLGEETCPDVLADSPARGEVQADRLPTLDHGPWSERRDSIYPEASP